MSAWYQKITFLDFLIVREGRPILAVEVKNTDQSLSRPLAERKNWISTDQTIGVQVIGKLGILQKHGDYTWVVSADRFLALPLEIAGGLVGIGLRLGARFFV